MRAGRRWLGAHQLDAGVRAEEPGCGGTAALPGPGDAAGARTLRTALARSHFPHTGALPPLNLCGGWHALLPFRCVAQRGLK